MAKLQENSLLSLSCSTAKYKANVHCQPHSSQTPSLSSTWGWADAMDLSIDFNSIFFSSSSSKPISKIMASTRCGLWWVCWPGGVCSCTAPINLYPSWLKLFMIMQMYASTSGSLELFNPIDMAIFSLSSLNPLTYCFCIVTCRNECIWMFVSSQR